jgi:hypothetical protein
MARRRPKKAEQGAVMLIVLLILLTATALATTSLQTTEFELRSAGYNRSAVQMQYVSAAAAATTMAWVDATSMDRSFLRHLQAWENYASSAGGGPPSMAQFGEPGIPLSNIAMANRTQWVQQSALAAVVLPPITNSSVSSPASTDLIGSFGPHSPYMVGVENPKDPSTDYIVDLYDCRMLPNTAAVGFQVNEGGSGTMRQVQYYCVVTSRGRAYVPTTGAASQTKQWTLGTLVPYTVNRFTLAHDSRGTIVTPPI